MGQSVTKKKIISQSSSGVNSATTTALALKVNKAGDTLSGPVNANKGTDIPSATTTDIGAATGEYVHITGTTTITGFGTVQAGAKREITFDGSLTLTSNTVSLILPGNANIQTTAGDVAIFVSEGSGNWRCVSYLNSTDTYINYTPTLTGCSTDPPLSAGLARYKMLTRNTCHVIVTPSTTGTSNATTKTITLPFNASSTGIQYCTIAGKDNNTDVSMTLRTSVGSNVASIFKTFITAHTASGTWTYVINIVYQIDI